MYDICNSIEDCPSKDDEFLCEVRDVVCPEMCMCLNLAVTCTKVTLELTNILNPPYVAYSLAYTGIDSFSFLQSSISVAVLNVSNN